MGPVLQILSIFGIVKLVHIVILYFVPSQFDILSSLFLESFLFEKEILCHFDTPYILVNRVLSTFARLLLVNVVDKLVVWDLVYFSNLFVQGPMYEHEYVFCPLWWRLISLIPEVKGTLFYPRLIAATFVANFAHLAAALVLYKYTLIVFENARIFSPKRMALGLLVLFVMTPAAAFMTAPYSEPMASFLSFLCLYLREMGLKSSPYVTSGPQLHMEGRESEESEESELIDEKRQDCVDVLDLDAVGGHTNIDVNEKSLNLRRRTKNIYKTLQIFEANCSSQLNSPQHSLTSAQLYIYLLSGGFAAMAYGFRANCLLLGILFLIDAARLRTAPPFVAGLFLGLAFAATQYANYVSICVGTDRGEWCNSNFPLLFTYAQAHYWNNGFFKYWTANNIPNFAFGAPTILISLAAVRYFKLVYPVDRVLPILAVNSIFVVLLLTMWHVQIVTRIHLFLPLNYWLVAGFLTQPNENYRRWGHLCVSYFVIWGVIQVSLFGAFLPPA